MGEFTDTGHCIRSSYVNCWPMKYPITFTYSPLYIHLVLLQEQLCLFPCPLYDAMFSVGCYIQNFRDLLSFAKYGEGDDGLLR